MKVPVNIAEKLLQLSQGESIPSSSAKHSLIEELVSEGILLRKGRIKKTLQLHDRNSLLTYLQSHCSINNLSHYIEVSKKKEIKRSELVTASSDSKRFKVRTFKGFLVNCYEPIPATLDNKQILLNPEIGSFQFIYDFEKFIPASEITIVGIENPENFRHIEKQKTLFNEFKPLFVSRYPQNQSKDLIKWLKLIPNNYLHFGDFDFAGIGIYMNEYKTHLNEKAMFFLPNNIEELIKINGNRRLYNEQKINFKLDLIYEINLLKLIGIIHKYRKGLEQEILIKNEH